MKPLHAAAHEALADFDDWSIRHVKREHNAEADRLVNEALDSAELTSAVADDYTPPPCGCSSVG